MQPGWHLVGAGIGAAAVQVATGEGEAALSFLVGGVVLDGDHVFEYCYRLGVKEGLQAILALDSDAVLRLRPHRIFLFLHGWEWAVGLLLAGWVADLTWLSYLGGGALLHLAQDQWWNSFRPLGYSFAYRLWYGFKTTKVRVVQGEGKEVGLPPEEARPL